MRKKLIPIALLVAAMSLACNAYAATLPDVDAGEDAVTVTDITTSGQNGGQNASIPDILPLSVETRAEGGVELLVKTYELPHGEDHAAIAAEKTERGGIEYTLREITKRELEPVTTSKGVTQTVTVSAPSDEMADILPLLGKRLLYDVDGYSGELLLDESSITTEVESTTGYSYTVKEVREYPGLTRNDPYLVPKSITDNGLTYTLAEIQWSGGSENAPAATYPATAVYTALASGQRPDGYAVTAHYSGPVTKEEPGNVRYMLIYEPVPAPVVSAPEVPTIDRSRVLWVGLGIAGIGGLAMGIVFLNRKFGIFKRKKRRQYHPDYEPEARPARRKPHALGYMKRDGGMEHA